jgi:hypothetical protein
LDAQIMNKTVVMLIGPKGSGKTHIGSVLERHTGVKFLRVEPLWLGLNEGQDGWAVVEGAIDDCLSRSDIVILESLGGSQGFERLRSGLDKKYIVRYVRIVTPLEICLERVRNRDSRNHIPVSDANVEAYNRLAAKVSLPWDFELSNEPPLTDQMILDAMQRIQQGGASEPLMRPAGL